MLFTKFLQRIGKNPVIFVLGMGPIFEPKTGVRISLDDDDDYSFVSMRSAFFFGKVRDLKAVGVKFWHVLYPKESRSLLRDCKYSALNFYVLDQ